MALANGIIAISSWMTGNLDNGLTKLQVLRCPTPFGRVYIGDGLRERPRVSSEILRGILALAVGLSQWFLGNPRLRPAIYFPGRSAGSRIHR
jgi:hypothetical protein